MELEHIHSVESVGVGGDGRKLSNVTLAVATGGEITRPEAILVDLFNGEKVICEHCEVNLFVTYLLSH